MSNGNAAAAGGSTIYALGIFGAIVYYWQVADGFWEHIGAIFQGLVWPAFLVYETFEYLGA